jgi:hypothetical protein
LYRFGLVILTMYQRTAAQIAAAFALGWQLLEVVDAPILGARTSGRETRHNLLVRDLDAQYHVDGKPACSKHLLQRFRLRNGSREPIEEKTSGGICLDDSLRDEADHHLIWDEFSLIHVRCGLNAQRSARPPSRPEHVPGRELRQQKSRFELFGLGSLACPRRPEKNDPHCRWTPF